MEQKQNIKANKKLDIQNVYLSNLVFIIFETIWLKARLAGKFVGSVHLQYFDKLLSFLSQYIRDSHNTET